MTYNAWLALVCCVLAGVVVVVNWLDRHDPPRELPEWTADPTAYNDEFWDLIDEMPDVSAGMALLLSGIDPEELRNG